MDRLYRSRVWGRRLTRRQGLTGAVLGGMGLAAASVFGCAREQQPAASTGTREPKRGGTLSHQNGGETTLSLDPHVWFPLAAMGYRLMYQGLLGYHLRTFEVEADLAQRWEQPSQTEYAFTLQPGVKWHNKPPANGRALTAEDIVFSLRRIQTGGPQFVAKTLLDTIDKIEAAGNTVRITTKGPDASMLDKLASDNTLVLAPEVVERAGRFATADVVVGTGPFIMTSVELGVGAQYVRNPDYWKPGLPYLDGLRTHHFEDDQPAYAAHLAGQLDITRIPGQEVKSYIAKQGSNYAPDWVKDITIWVTQPNVKVKPFDDMRVTRATRLLIDHDEFIKAWAESWYGRGAYVSIFAPSMDNWDLTQEEYKTHLEWKQPKDEAVRVALDLLRAAGFSRENPLRFELVGHATPPGRASAELLQAQWRRLSQGVVDASLRIEEQTIISQLQNNRAHTYILAGLGGAVSEPGVWLNQIYRTGAARNYFNFNDPKLDEMIDRLSSTFDLQRRKLLVREIITYMIDHGPNTIPSARFFLNATKPQVRDFIPEYWLAGRQYDRVWLDT